MGKWQRFRFQPLLPLGEDGSVATGSKKHIALSRKAAGEGMVLLKNEQKTLPLAENSRVALFGKASVDYVKGGGGSGDVIVAYVRNLCQGMEEKQEQGKVSCFLPLHEFYRENVAAQRKEGKRPGYTVEPELPQELLQAAADFCDTAIISICRFSSEGGDRKGEANDGDFYLSCQEQKMVDAVTEAFSKVIVVLNVGGMVDSSWFIRNEKIHSVLLGWQGGQEGAMAQADILCGDVNPSGKLVDTFASSFDDYPSSYNFNESADYVCYTDDIFVGYRYFETIPNAAEKVNYPFGFGLSYTTFDIRCLETRLEEELQVTVRVTNTGDVPGKEVVQLYSSAAFRSLDVPKLELRAFRKTKELAPGESQELELKVPVAELASYDEAQAAYVLAEKYTLLVGNCVRDLQTAGVYETGDEKVVLQLRNRCVPSKLPCRLHSDGTYEKLEMSEYTPKEDTSSWPVRKRWNAEHILPNQHGIKVPEDRIPFDHVASGKATMEEFMAHLSDDELITLVGGTPNRGVADTMGLGGLDIVDIPAAMTADGPAGLRINADRGVKTTAWPVSTLLACTWDEELLYQVGVCAAVEVKENNIAMWLAPAINIHRSPLCGRNFEYYSEDPLVAGKLSAAMIRGVQSQNISACVKHLCVNNKEHNRSHSDSRLSERALREIYLKGFEIAVKEGKVWSIMTSYNLLNGTYTGENAQLLRGIVREEWGYTGLIITDWESAAEHYREVVAGNNVRMPYGDAKRLQIALEKGWINRELLMENARYMLELLLKLD